MEDEDVLVLWTDAKRAAERAERLASEAAHVLATGRTSAAAMEEIAESA